jgi:DNA-binding transcriptional regulator of glucitol operon
MIAMKLTHIVLTVALAALPATSFAQKSTYNQRHQIAHRKTTQQGRIAQGVKSGQLTPHETARLEHQERGINKEEHGMRAEDNGHLTAQDRHTLAAQQNTESKRIYNEKHNIHTDPGVPPAPR